MELHHVMPAREFLAPIVRTKEAISAALDSLQAGGQSHADASLFIKHAIFLAGKTGCSARV